MGRFAARMRTSAYCTIFEHSVRYGVAKADLSLLKGRALHARYGRYARNAKDFEDTSYLSSGDREHARSSKHAWRPSAADVRYGWSIAADSKSARALRLRLSWSMPPGARSADRAPFDWRWTGTRGRCKALASASAQRDGFTSWAGGYTGRSCLRNLAEYDALLFTPLAEDTPRMIFDGYAAGLPLVGFDIEYVRSCSARDRAAVVLPSQDREQSARMLVDLAERRQPLAATFPRSARCGARPCCRRLVPPACRVDVRGGGPASARG